MNYSKYGRFGDTKIRPIDGKPAHVNNKEASLLDMIGKRAEPFIKQIGAGSINPITGLKEYHGDYSGEVYQSGVGDYGPASGLLTDYPQLFYHNSPGGGTHRHTSPYYGNTALNEEMGWNLDPSHVDLMSIQDNIQYDRDGDGNYEHQTQAGGQGFNFYDNDPFMVEGINQPETWYERWSNQGYDNAYNYPRQSQLSGDSDVDWETIKMLYETGDINTWAEKYHDLSPNQIEMGTDVDFWLGQTGIDPFEEEHGQYALDMESAETDFSTSKVDALTKMKRGIGDLKFGVGQDLKSLKQEELSKAVGSGFAMGGGFMRGTSAARKGLLGGYQQGIKGKKEDYEVDLNVAQGTYDIAADEASTTLSEDIGTAKQDYINNWIAQLGNL